MREQHALALAAREVAHAALGLVLHTHLRKGGVDLCKGLFFNAQEQGAALAHGCQKVAHSHGQAAVAFNCLRHIGKAAWGFCAPMQLHFARVRHQPQYGFEQAAFAAAVGAYQGMDLAWLHVPVNRVKNTRAAKLQCDLLQVQGGPARAVGSAQGLLSRMERTTASRLCAMAFSNVSAL